MKRGSGRIVNKASLANIPGVVERELVQAWEARKTTNTGAAIRQVVSSSVAISNPVGRLIVVEAQSVYLKAGAAYSCHVQAFKLPFGSNSLASLYYWTLKSGKNRIIRYSPR